MQADTLTDDHLRRNIRCKRAPTHLHLAQTSAASAAHPAVDANTHLRAWVDNGVFVSPHTFRDMAHHVFDEFYCHFDPDAVREGEIVFVNTFLLCPFMNVMHPRIR